MRALVLSGGGSKGAYQAGALKHLLGDLRIQYDIICGVSVGALNGAFIAQYRLGQEQEAAEGLAGLWGQIKNSRVRRYWYWGLLGILPVLLPRWLGGRQSVYNNAPLRKLVDRYLVPRAVVESKKRLYVSAVSLRDGARRVWTEQDPAHLKKAVLASASFPMFFEPVEIAGEMFTDAGVREVTPVEDAILAGATEIHVINLSPLESFAPTDSNIRGLELAMRVLDAMGAEVDKWDMKVTELYNALAQARHPKGMMKRVVLTKVLRPSAPLPVNPLDFDNRKARLNFEQGYRDAKAMSW